MCKFKSGIILKDKVFMPDYNSHTSMLEELGISDTTQNAKTKFIRAEIYPQNGEVFSTDILNWKYKVDQDILPNWYVSDYDEKRVRDALSVWMNDGYENTKQLSELSVGDNFKIGNVHYVILDKTDEGVHCLTKNFITDNKKFDTNSNNFNTSEINTYLNTTYYEWLSNEIGRENIIEHDVDLLSLDGLDDYETVKCKISLLTLDQYRKYRNTIPKLDTWWWLATPYSTPNGYGAYCVCGVGSGGDVYYFDCRYGGGVRPFCILKSSLLVSCK